MVSFIVSLNEKATLEMEFLLGSEAVGLFHMIFWEVSVSLRRRRFFAWPWFP
jgi:hypothetical protein